jgi:hypothetical protein
MRRFLVPLLSLSFLVSAFGCGHWAGVCDCQIGTDWCVYPPWEGNIKPVVPAGAVAPAGAHVPIVNGSMPMPAGETLKEMPKAIPDNNEPPTNKLPGKELPPIQ